MPERADERERPAPPWRVRADTGGTFTDCVAFGPDNEARRAKVLSSGALRGAFVERVSDDAWRVRLGFDAPDGFLVGARLRPLAHDAANTRGEGVAICAHDADASLIEFDAAPDPAPEAGDAFEIVTGEEAPVLAARVALGVPCDQSLPEMDLRIATTRGTNALLEGAGAPTALFVTEGFADLLTIGDQSRPDLFALEIVKPQPIARRVIEVPARMDAAGATLRQLRLDALDKPIQALLDDGVRVAAVALMHSDLDASHERALRDRLLERGFTHVSASSDVAPSIGLLARARTAVVDAHLSPVIDGYLDRIAAGAPGSRVRVMTSAGGLVDRASYRAMDSLLSGPAGGVAGALGAAMRSGYSRVIAFDMGGTSTDASRIDGDFRYVYEHEVGGVRVMAPALAIESVASGGGSECWFDGTALRVGPKSAGASPGPACYGAGGPLTITDANLLLGRLDPRAMPIPIDEHAAERAADALLETVNAARTTNDDTGCSTWNTPGTSHDARTSSRDDANAALTREAMLESFLAIANDAMAGAIRRVSVREGYDPADHALVAFGGAGGLHACGVASRLGMRDALLPPDAGLLSAVGLDVAALERFAHRQLLTPLSEIGPGFAALLRELEREAVVALREDGVPESDARVRRRILEARYEGQESAITLDIEVDADLREAFETAHEQTHGHTQRSREIECVSLRVVASTRRDAALRERSDDAAREAKPTRTRRAWFDGAWVEAPVYERSSLRTGDRVAGPALIVDAHSGAALAPGWVGVVDEVGAVALTRSDESDDARDSEPAGARLELFTNRLRSVAAEMGETLRRTAFSANVKERLDFSCALLDARGGLAVNAPHIPVHLGAMGVCVRRVVETMRVRPGDVIATNHPGFGGSHLPDVTVLTGAFDDEGELIGYAAARAHHAEIGGRTPGSMPPDARTLDEEGVVILPVRIVEGGRETLDALTEMLRGARFPSRRVEENIADLRAAVAACLRGAADLRRLASAVGVADAQSLMERVQSHSAERLRTALQGRGDFEGESSDAMDDGSPVRVRIVCRDGRLTIDFAGSSPAHPGNLNAPEAVVRSAVMYALRLLVRDDLPLNEGFLRDVDLRIPRGMLHPAFEGEPHEMPAVAAGNVETSQRTVDALLRALDLCACSQGTMNNVLFGNDGFSHYETIGGGAGAGPGFAGASGVHTHMTNTRITDAEVMERRFPVRVERFALRSGSGGGGERRGGEGLTREIVFLEPVSVSVVTQRRGEGPPGAHGGDAGTPGRQRIVRADGAAETLGAVDGGSLDAGDRLIVETPGGGGWGAAPT
ncbi:MAG: hypothetical protein EA379_07495 [Phycisphaerales bacterium]|nr:MAG: hypothetical protein EA379_07495 [Phycisphaerales bacterium]